MSNSPGWVISRNPATGEEIGRIAETPPSEVDRLVSRVAEAQNRWASLPLSDRLAVVRRFASLLSRDADALACAIRDEIGKPWPEASFEVVAALDAVRWTIANAPGVLRESRLGAGWQRVMLLKPARLAWCPLGVVGLIGTWNYPVYLDVPALAQALVAGNGVAWKPSERSSGVARFLESRLVEAGVPDGLVAIIYGGPAVGEALTKAPIAKGFFTGGIANGRGVIASLAARGIPAVAELSGFDAAIVLPDARLESTVPALTWAAFVGAGQTCVAVKRVYVVGDATPWAKALAERAKALRVGAPRGDDVDIGPMISASARAQCHETIRSAVSAGATVLHGGEPIEGPGAFYPPTVLLADDAAPESALAGVFGPVVVVRGVAGRDDAIRAANATEFGLAASVWGRDRRQLREVASRIEAGMVAINDAVTPSGLASSPFGGVKGSGFGRVHGELGLREFVQPKVIHERSPGGFRPHLFPYSARLAKIVAVYHRFIHPPA